MALNVNYGNLLARPKSAMEYQQDYAAMDDAKAARQVNALALQEKRAQLADAETTRADQTAYRNALSTLPAGANQDQLISTIEGVRNPYAMTQAQALRKAQLDDQVKKSTLATNNLTLEQARLKAQAEKHDQAINDVLTAQDPKQAMELLQRYSQAIKPESMQGMTRELMGVQTADQLEAWKQRRLDALIGAKGAAELAMKRLELQAKQRESASTLANRELVIGPDGQPRVNQPYVDAKARVAQAGAAVSYGSPVPFMLPDGSQGLAQTNNRGTSASVVKVDGVPVKAPPKEGKAPPVEFTKSVAGLKELENGLASYEQALKDYGGGSPLAMGDRRAGLQGAYTSLQMGLKNAFELGALAGPDLSLLEGMLASPTSFQAGALGDKGLAEQITQARQYLRNRGKAVYEAHKMPVPPEYAGAGGSAKTNKAGGAAVPDDIKALLDKHGGK